MELICHVCTEEPEGYFITCAKCQKKLKDKIAEIERLMELAEEVRDMIRCGDGAGALSVLHNDMGVPVNF